MTINEFAKRVTQREGKIIQVNIAQTKELLKEANIELKGELYKMIRAL